MLNVYQSVIVLAAISVLSSDSAAQQQFKLTPSNRDANDEFGFAVAVDGNVAVLGAPYKQCPAGSGCGATMLFRFDGTSWVQESGPLPTDEEAEKYFGRALSLSGDLLLVGAPGDRCAPGVLNCGAAYVFRHVGGGSWLQEAKLIPSNRSANDNFGFSVAIHGNVAALGSPDKPCPGGSSCGATMLFRYNGSSWVQEAGPLPSDQQASKYFGFSLSLRDDLLLVGAIGDQCLSGLGCGAAYVFRHVGGGSWPQEIKLVPSDRNQQDWFGASVALHGDVAAIGAPFNDCSAGVDCGQVFLFRNNGTSWIDEGGVNALDQESADLFGEAVAFWGDDVAAGARGDDCPFGELDCGSVYVFSDMDGEGWVQQSKHIAFDAASEDYFGVDIAGTEEWLLAGALYDDCAAESDCGAGYAISINPPPDPTPIQSALIGYWKLDGNYTDLSPGHRHLTPAGGIAFGPGVLGQGLLHPGDAGQYVSRIVDDAVFNFGATDFTVSAWVYYDSVAGEQIIVEKWTGPSSPGWTFTKLASNQFQFEAAGLGVATSAPQSIATGVWHHLVAVRSGSSLTIHFDNAVVATAAASGSITPSTRPLVLGRRDGAQLFPMNGRIDEVAIWSRALSATEITDLYTAHQMICGCTTQPSGFAGGDGSPENPFQVCSPLHLDNVRNHLSAHFVQMADIDLDQIVVTPLGNGDLPFGGSYDGAFFVISNLTVTQPLSPWPTGLFGTTSSPSLIRGIVLVDVSITGNSHVGGLVGYHQGAIEHCTVSGAVNGTGMVGVLCGYTAGTGTIQQSASFGSAAGHTRVGGLTGEVISGGVVSNSYSMASATSSSSDLIGGLLGILRGGAVVENSYSTGAASGVGTRIGGLVGLNQGTVVQASYWDMQASGVSTSDGGISKTTAEMQMQSTFDPPWDFVDVWQIDEGNDYPRLRWEAITPPGPSETSCDNALDDDCDSFVDCDDSECKGNAACILAPDPVMAESPAMGKVRFISFVVPATSAGTDTALRVELTSLHHPSSPPPGTPNFTAFEGQFRYVNSFGGSTLCVDSATFTTNYRCGQLGCQPEYRDWATDLSAATNPASPAGLIHVTGDAVAPNSTLTVSHIAASCGAAPAADTCALASAGLAVSTSRWGDVGGGGGAAPDGSANVIDIGLVVDNVKGLATAIAERRAWMKNPTSPAANPVNVIDIGLTVDAVKGLPYPYSIAACP